MLKTLNTTTIAIALTMAYLLGSGMTLMAISLPGIQQTDPPIWFTILDYAGVAVILVIAGIIFLAPWVLLFDLYRNPCRTKQKG